jgi:3',5'-nucleoside bisphosphate phosphatase
VGEMRLEKTKIEIADLHLHTSYSDGNLSPVELMKKVSNIGLNCISIVDHDIVDATEEAIELGKKFDIEVIPGVELSTNVDNIDIHMIGYFIDHKNETLLDYLKFFREERLKRAERIVNKLNKLKVPLKIESVIAQNSSGSIGRPHIANALVEEGLIRNYQEAFDQYIRNGGPAYEHKYTLNPSEAISIINKAGGLSFLAHPNYLKDEKIFLNLIEQGIDGIEIVHPSHSNETIQHLEKIANEYFLLTSGGSDFHGGLKNDEHSFGAFTVPYKMVTAMKQRLFKK